MSWSNDLVVCLGQEKAGDRIDMSERMRIHVNGEARDVGSGISVATLLRELGLDGRTVVVELNRQIIRRTEIEDMVLETGDRIELVHFVGGG